MKERPILFSGPADSWHANPWVDVCEFRKAVEQ